jgi:hypothetical protein
MSIKPLNERLDELSTVEQDVAALPPESEPLDPTTLTDQNPEFEPTLVAGFKGMLRETIKRAPKRTERPILPEGTETGKIGPYSVIKDAKPAQAEAIEKATPTMPTTGKPSPTPTEVAAGVPETVLNLDLIDGPDTFKQHIEAVARSVGADKFERISYTDFAAKASAEGYDETFVARLLDPSVATEADYGKAYKMLLVQSDASKRTYDLGLKVKQAKKDGELTDDLSSQFLQAIAYEGAVVKAVKGRQIDIARSLGIFSQARQSSVNRGEMLSGLMTEAGGINSAFDLANKYTALSSKSAMGDLAEKTISGTLKDIWFSTWINGLLSSPVTHAKNIAGNLFFGALQMPERAVASFIGKGRNLFFKGGEEAISMNEVYAQAAGFLQGIREGGEIAATAFVKNTSTDPFTKIETGRVGRDAFDIDFGDSETGKAFSNALRYWGKFVTLPGRALMAEDEFYKAVGYRMELNALAVREGDRMYKKLIQTGLSPDDAAKQASDLTASLLANPTPDVDEAAKAVSRTVTFTRELEKSLQGMQSVAQYPLIKIFVPFIKTPTNIALEAFARTPGLNFASPRFWGDYNAGGIRRDQAMARVTLGGAMMYSVSAGVFEGKLTGYGPMRGEDKKALEGTGWQPFSFMFNKSDVDPDLLAEFEKITSVKYGPDKVYISYAGLEPIATLLGIGATAGEYAQLTRRGSDLDKMAMGSALGVYQYLSEQPAIQGFNEVVKIFTSGSKDGPSKLYDFIKNTSKQVTEFAVGGSPLGAHSSFVASVERIVDPTRSNTMPEKMSTEFSGMDAAVRGFYEAVNYYKSRNSLTSDSLPRQYDPITGDVQKVGKGNLYEMFNPFKLADGKFSPAHAVLVEYGVPLDGPDKSIEGIELSATQYNRWIELATQDGILAKAIENLGPNLEEKALTNLGAAQAIIKKEISDRYSMAKKTLIAEDPDLAEALRDVEQLKREYGNYKR